MRTDYGQMKSITILTMMVLIAVSNVACDTRPLTPTQTNVRNMIEETEIRSVVENFGKRLRSVSHQSPNTSQEMKEQFSEFISLDLLE
jgi:hypothetical protein